MKNLLLFFTISVLLFSQSCRKDLLHWQAVETIPNTGNTQWNTIAWLSNGVGIIGGGSRFEKAVLIVSKDMGKTWTQRTMPKESKGFFCSNISPNGNAYFGGFGLNVCYSSDAFSTNNFGRIPGPYEFPSAISFAEEQHAVIVSSVGTDSGKIIHCDNNLQFLSAKSYPFALHDIEMFDAQKGIAVGSGVILKTQDGGYTWQHLPVKGDNFYRIAAIDSLNIFVCGNSGTIVKTTDGGYSWQRVRNGSDITLPRYSLWDIYFENNTNVYAVGEKGLVIYTDDAGKHWSEFDRFTQENLRIISPSPDGKLIVGGENGALFRVNKK